MSNKGKLALSFIVIIFFSSIILGMSLNSMGQGQEADTSYNVCLETQKTLDADAEEIKQLNDTIKRDLIVAEHNLAVENFNVRCGDGNK